MHYLNHAHSDLFIINEAHLSENEMKGLWNPGPNRKAACPDSYASPTLSSSGLRQGRRHARSGRGLTGSKEHGYPLSHLLGCVTLCKSHPLAESVSSLVNDSAISEYLINESFSSLSLLEMPGNGF